MDVYLVPSGRMNHELYCEVTAVVIDGRPTAPASLWQRMSQVFHRLLAEGERVRDAPHDSPASHSRARRFVTRKLAEAVAEQRLLWNLRGQTEVELLHPDDMPSQVAVDETRRLVGADRDKHRRWAVIDGLLILISAPFALLPGPNVLAYYFIFRTVGHVLSMRGAQQGLSVIRWNARPSAPLTELRQALTMPPEARCSRIDAIAATLGLERLATFVEKITGI
ncbi:MAG: hypothetical protein ABI634_04325 [Acidobacteriota bacterium]